MAGEMLGDILSGEPAYRAAWTGWMVFCVGNWAGGSDHFYLRHS